MLVPLALILAVSLVACAAPPAPQEIVTADFVLHPMGSATLSIGLGVSELIEQEHPWLRLNACEGPGATGNVYNMLTNPKFWGNKMMTATSPDYYMAEKGLSLFEEKGPFPDVYDIVGYLGNANITTVGLYTLDPNIKTEKDLAGKRIALGKIGQTAWGLLPTVVLQDIAELDVSLEYLKPVSATKAMIDGKADAAAILMVVSPDFTVIRPPGAVVEMVATGRDFYWISWSDELMKKAEATGWGPYLNPVKIAPGVFPGIQPDPLYMTLLLCGFTGHKELFPEELAYEFAKFYAANSDKLGVYTAMADTLAEPESLVYGVPEEYFHPGALRAYKEAGLIK